MARLVTVGAAQLGPIQRADSRASVVERMLVLMQKAHEQGCNLVVFPELALTTFFPRWYFEDTAEADKWFETSMPSAQTKPLFEAAKRYGMGFHLGYAEKIEERGIVHHYNTAILVDASGAIIGKYRKVHLPGHAQFDPKRRFQHLEKRYFEVGNLGFRVWRVLGGIIGMCVCNDRRWPETFRVMGLQGVEMVVLGYNTPTTNSQADEPPRLRSFHNELSMQAGAYQNSTWVVGVAKAGREDGHELMGGSAIVAPTGEIIAQAQALADELVVAACDLDKCAFGKQSVFDFAAHRRIEHYGLITQQTGVAVPE
jgi:N-carbamoyl-D-amino-acid hydrolase